MDLRKWLNQLIRELLHALETGELCGDTVMQQRSFRHDTDYTGDTTVHKLRLTG